MPLYEHACPTHGSFTDVRGFDESGHQAACPSCGLACDRVVSLPRQRAMSQLLLKAMERNEKSRHEPHVCSSSCQHHHPQQPPAAEAKPMPQMYLGPRPWVIEHAL